MAKRKLYPVEEKVLKIEIDALKSRKDWLVEQFVKEISMIDEQIENVKKILEAGEIEEEVFDGC